MKMISPAYRVDYGWICGELTVAAQR